MLDVGIILILYFRLHSNFWGISSADIWTTHTNASAEESYVQILVHSSCKMWIF